MDPKEFIGRKVNMKKSVHTISGRKYEYFSIDDAAFEKEVTEHFGYVRFIDPGSRITVDARPERLNIKVGKDGIVYGVEFG